MKFTHLTAVVLLALCAQKTQADLIIEIGSATVDISPGSGVVTASIDVSLVNNGIVSEDARGYTLLYNIEPDNTLPAGNELPTGVSFSDPAVTSGNLFPATPDFTINFTGAAEQADIAISEVQTGSSQSFAAGFDQVLHTLNFDVDLATAVAGVYAITLNQNAASDGIADGPFTTFDPAFTAGSLTLEVTPIPEPTSFVMLAVAGAGGWCAARRRRRRG